MSTSTHIYLLRHGACEGGLIFRGRTDSPLSSEGEAQMVRSLSWLHQQPLQHIVSSPLRRCQAPARAYARERDLPLILEPQLAEIDFGQWEGREVAALEHTNPEAIARFWRDPVAHPPPGGEPMMAFQQRVVAAWTALLERFRGQTLLLVTHGGVIRLILAHLLDMPLRPLSHLHVPHGCLSQVAVYHSDGKPDWPQLLFHNGRPA